MKNEILYLMPKSFTRKDFVRAVVDAGRTVHRADQLLHEHVTSGDAERSSRGHYKRNNVEFYPKTNEEE